jgi:ADP-ribosyl-[dinitrogen reductase] hydrolase
MKEQAKSLLFGVAAGDALGVPVEFRDRNHMRSYPVQDMMGYGTHNQPAGTWSDDSSLTFCLAEALTNGFDLDAIGNNFIRWYRDGFWTARGEVFDIGGATYTAIHRLMEGVNARHSGSDKEASNGNGSLMRIAPLVFYLKEKPAEERFAITKLVSSITHAHIRSVIACFYYMEFCRGLLNAQDKFLIYQKLKEEFAKDADALHLPANEVRHIDRLLNHDICLLGEDEIQSSGYVIDTLEASVWCLLTTGSYSEAVLKAVNLGGDTDTTAAVTGGLAGLLYGFDAIPAHWVNQLAKMDPIADLAERMAGAMGTKD